MPIICDICPRNCRFEDGQTGFCNVRKNVNGENVDRWYGVVDYDGPHPIAGLMTLLPGCNLQCSFCCLRYLSKREPDISDFRDLSPLRLVQIAVSYGVHEIVLMGAEPALHHEYVSEVARLSVDANLSTALLTSGYLNPWLVEKLAGVMSMISVDIKASGNKEVYRRMNADPIVCFETARILWRMGKLVGIQNLIGPGLGTPEDDVTFARWVSANISTDIPVMLIPLSEPSPTRVKWGEDMPCVDSDSDTRKRMLETAARLQRGGITNLHPLWVRDE